MWVTLLLHYDVTVFRNSVNIFSEHAVGYVIMRGVCRGVGFGESTPLGGWSFVNRQQMPIKYL